MPNSYGIVSRAISLVNLGTFPTFHNLTYILQPDMVSCYQKEGGGEDHATCTLPDLTMAVQLVALTKYLIPLFS